MLKALYTILQQKNVFVYFTVQVNKEIFALKLGYYSLD